MSNSNEVGWDPSIWKEINDAVVAEVRKVRTAQKVFPTMLLETNPTEIPNDVIDFTDLNGDQRGRARIFSAAKAVTGDRAARAGWGDEGTPTNTAGSDANDCR